MYYFYLSPKHFIKSNMKILLTITLASFTFSCTSQKNYLLVGTYTGTGSKGIYVYQFNTNNGDAKIVDSIESSNPSFLTVAPGGKYVYAVNEDADSAKKEGGGISAYAFNAKTGKLRFINKTASRGSHPCYITTDNKGKWVIAGNYSSGNFSISYVRKDGGLAGAHQTVQHNGSSVNTERQNSAHVHATVFSSDNRHLYVTDLGTDKIVRYPFNTSNGKVNEALRQETKAEPGSGPRHLAFHPNNKFVYVMQELTASVTVYKNNKGTFAEIQSHSSHPLTYKGPAGSADIHVSPDGNFLYCSNRALSNTIAIFRINKNNGTITLVGHEYTKGVKPRNFNFDPTGKFLLVANQETNEIVVFKRNKQTGLLTDTEKRIWVPKPVCLQWGKGR